MKEPAIHWSGGACYVSRGMTCHMGPGFPCCCSGDRAERLSESGNQVFNEEDAGMVTCRRCLEILGRRLPPGVMGKAMGIPDPPVKP